MSAPLSVPVARILHRAAAEQGEPSADRLTLDYAGRFLRRKRLATDAGAAVLVDLPEAVSLDAGDVLETEDGARIAVAAADEPLYEVRGELARLAWHIGNRHTPAEIGDGRLLIRRDHVLADMLRRLGADLREIVAPFTPEGGAYGHGRTHSHHHGGATDDPRGDTRDEPHHHVPDHGRNDNGSAHHPVHEPGRAPRDDG